MYKKLKLGNGIRIVGLPLSGRQSLAIGIWVRVGGRYESKVNKGISHYLEHLVFKGTKKYSCYELKESIEGIGGSLNGFTSEEATCYLVKVPSRYLSLGIDVLSEMVISPTLADEEIEKERNVILEEIKMYKDVPQSYVHEVLDNLLWPDQPLGMSILGSQDSINRIKRQDLNLFKNRNYTGPNVVISIVGNFDYAKFVGKVKKAFSQFNRNQAEDYICVKEEQERPNLEIIYRNTEQTHLSLGFHALRKNHPFKHALSLLHIILGANMSSRLFNELREKRGLAYEIGTHLKRFADTGAFIVHAGIPNKKVEEAIDLILGELNKVKKELVSEEELKRAKDFYLGQLMLGLEDTLEHMLWIGDSTISLDKTFSLREIIKEVNQVKKEQVKEISEQIFLDTKLNLALIGPLEGRKDSIYGHLRLN